MTSRVLILGGTGMLGSAIIDVFVSRKLAITATTRDLSDLPPDWRQHFVQFDVVKGDLAELLSDFGPGDYVVNCVGVIKHHIDDASFADRRNAIAINAEFPYSLVEIAERQGFRVIQIATDCVYSGASGKYDEDSLHDATDVYGQTKSLGEVPSPAMLNLRCSIIGPELRNKVSLLEWVLSHEPGSSFSGYTDHRWNGVTARAFGRVVSGIVESRNTIAGSYHLLPADDLDKSQLSSMILGAFGQSVTVVPTDTGNPVDRTLATRHPEVSARLWLDAGYQTAPHIQDMIDEVAAHHPSYQSEEQ